MTIKFTILFSLLFSLNLYADGGYGEIARLYPYADKVHFRLKNDPCTNTATNEYYTIDMVAQAPAAQARFSMLLAASATGKQVKVSVHDCSIAGNKDVRYVYQDF